MNTWITMDEACRTLGVRPQTLYAYASRGKIEVQPDRLDSRRSLYRAEDVQQLARRKHAGRKPATLASNAMFGAEPSIPTALCTIGRGRLSYRGEDALALARSATVEQVAALLWQAEQPVQFGGSSARAATTEAEPGPGARTDGAGRPGRVRAFMLLARQAATGHSTRGRTRRVLQQEAQDLVGQLAMGFGAAPAAKGPDGTLPALHQRLAGGWRLGNRTAELLRVAMVLLADHELTSSAFAARIAASTGASLPACLLAGLATFSGPAHGDASGQVRALIDEVQRLGPEAVVQRHLSAGLPMPGFGHHLYPDGDPRAAELLGRFAPPPAIARFIAQVGALTGQPPTIDLALAALVVRHRMPADAAFAIFATARSVGLLAHAIEQLAEPQVIRPRGRYVGPVPERSAPQPGLAPSETR